MKILHVVPSYYPAVRYGGPIRSVHALAAASAGRGHDVSVYTTNIDGPSHSDVPLDRAVHKDGVSIHYFAPGLGRRFYRSPTMGRALRMRIPDFDILHLHSVFLWPTTAAARIARRSGTPYVLAPRGMLVRDLIRRKSRLAKEAWIHAFERRNLKDAAAIHVTSSVEAEEFKALQLAHRKLAHIPNGIDAEECEEAQGSPDPHSTTPLDRPYLLFLSRLNWKKGLDRLIAAMAKIQDLDLVVAGNDEEDYTPELKAMASRLGISDRVHFIGPVYDGEKWAWMSHAELFILPSYSENFGNVVLEAMSAGRAVIVTPEVGAAEIVENTGAGRVVDGAPETLASAVNELIGDPDLRREMGRRGRTAAVANFDWRVIARDIESLYAECMR